MDIIEETLCDYQYTYEQYGIEENAVWTTAQINDFPDSSFAAISPGGSKDEEGKTTPRSLRHLPYKDKGGKVDAAHVRNALARLKQTHIPDAAKRSALRKLCGAAKSVGVSSVLCEEGLSAEDLAVIEAEVKELQDLETITLPLEFHTAIVIENAEDKQILITGIALAEGTWLGVFYPYEVIKTLNIVGKPVLVEHGRTSQWGFKIVGKIVAQELKDDIKALIFKARITEPNAIQAVLSKKLPSVSISVLVETKDISGKTSVILARGFELSLVVKPACKICHVISVEQSLSSTSSLHICEVDMTEHEEVKTIEDMPQPKVAREPESVVPPKTPPAPPAANPESRPMSVEEIARVAVEAIGKSEVMTGLLSRVKALEEELSRHKAPTAPEEDEEEIAKKKKAKAMSEKKEVPLVPPAKEVPKVDVPPLAPVTPQVTPPQVEKVEVKPVPEVTPPKEEEYDFKAYIEDKKVSAAEWLLKGYQAKRKEEEEKVE